MRLTAIFGSLLAVSIVSAQDKPPVAAEVALPMRTEADARLRAEANRRARDEQQQTGKPVELIPDYVAANIGPVPDSLGVSPFYKKYTDATGIPVIASEKVPGAALLVARDSVDSMLATRPDGRKHYATTNAGEYWAEGVQWWFFSNYGECFAGNVKVETPEEFAAYDPVLKELIGRVFTTHRIPMDVFHGRRIRPVKCP